MDLMTLAVATLVPSGIAIAADSRTSRVLPSGRHHVGTDNANKLFILNSHSAGATAGIANIDGVTIYKHIERFKKTKDSSKRGRPLIDAVAAYFKVALVAFKPKLPENFDFARHVLKLLIGAYHGGEADLCEITLTGPDYVPEITVASTTSAQGQPGPAVIGMAGTTYRLLAGYDLRFNIDALPKDAVTALQEFSPKLNYYVMELQDAVEFSVFLVETTMMMQRFSEHEPANVGGQIDVAVITDGQTRYLRCKELTA